MYSAKTSISRSSSAVPTIVISPRLRTYAVCAMASARWTNYTAPCLELVSKDAEVINLGVAPQTAIAIIEECQLQGYEGVFSAGMNSITAPEFEAIEGLRLIGGINGFPWWADDPLVQTYRDVNEQYGDGSDVRNSSATTT